MGYVYVFEAGKHCKIGISDKSVEQRKMSIQTGCPVKIQRVWCSRNIPDALACEKRLHNYFRQKNTSGEWFEIPFFEAAEEADENVQTDKYTDKYTDFYESDEETAEAEETSGEAAPSDYSSQLVQFDQATTQDVVFQSPKLENNFISVYFDNFMNTSY